MPKFREEVLNVELANALSQRGLVAHAETVSKRKLPDVLVELGGLKLVIEGRKESQKASLISDAKARIETGFADLSMAILYPEALSSAQDIQQLRNAVEETSYDGAFFSITSQGVQQINFKGETLDGLAQIVRNGFRARVKEDVVRTHVEEVEAAIEDVVADASESDLFSSSEVLVDRLSSALGVDATESAEK